MRAKFVLGILGGFLLGGCILLDKYNYAESGAGGVGGTGGKPASSSSSGGPGGSGGTGGTGGNATTDLWSRRYGDQFRQTPRSVAITQDGSVYVAGTFQGTIELEKSAMEPMRLECSAPDGCPFLMRLDAHGKPQWIKTIDKGQTLGQSVPGIGAAVVANGNDVIWAGHVVSTADPDAAPNVNTIFVERRAANGDLIYGKFIGETADHRVNAITLRNGTLYVAGTMTTYKSQVPIPCSGMTHDSGGVENLIVFALGIGTDPDFQCVWGRAFSGGVHPANSLSIAANTSSVYVSGIYEGGTITEIKLPQIPSTSKQGTFLLQLGAMGAITKYRGFVGVNDGNPNSIVIASLLANDDKVFLAGAISGRITDTDSSGGAGGSGGGGVKAVYESPLTNGIDAFVASLRSDLTSMDGTSNFSAFHGTGYQTITGLALRGPDLFATGVTVGAITSQPNSLNSAAEDLCAIGAETANCIVYYRLNTSDLASFSPNEAAMYGDIDKKLAMTYPIKSAYIAIAAGARVIAAGADGPVKMTGNDDLANTPSAGDFDLVIGHWPAP